MSGCKKVGGDLVKSSVPVTLAALVALALSGATGCVQSAGDRGGEDGSFTDESVLEGDESGWNGPASGARHGDSSLAAGNAVLRGRLDLGGRPPWDKGPHPDPWAPPQPESESGTPSGSTGTGTSSGGNTGTSSSSGSPNGK